MESVTASGFVKYDVDSSMELDVVRSYMMLRRTKQPPVGPPTLLTPDSVPNVTGDTKDMVPIKAPRHSRHPIVYEM